MLGQFYPEKNIAALVAAFVVIHIFAANQSKDIFDLIAMDIILLVIAYMVYSIIMRILDGIFKHSNHEDESHT